MATTEITVSIQPNDRGNPPGKLADAELHFRARPDQDDIRLLGGAADEDVAALDEVCRAGVLAPVEHREILAG